jgi:hypothetical protein
VYAFRGVDFCVAADLSCSIPLNYWLLGMIGLGYLVLISSTIGVVCMFVGNLFEYEAKELARKDRYGDGGVELIDDEKREDFDEFEDEPAEEIKNTEMSGGEVIYHKYVVTTGRLYFC